MSQLSMSELAKGMTVAVICKHEFVVFFLTITISQKNQRSVVAGVPITASGPGPERTFRINDLLGTPQHVRTMQLASAAHTLSFSELMWCKCILGRPAPRDHLRLASLRAGRKKR